MGKAVLISIRPQWCDLIASGKKSIEVRKTRPKLATPFRCYIYESLGKVKIKSMDIPTEQGGGTIDFYSHEGIGKIIGEFVCKGFVPFLNARPCFTVETPEEIERAACMTREEIWAYAPEGNPIGWRISNLMIYATPRDLKDFRRACHNDWYCESCAMYSENGNTCGNEALRLARPPQSWCYVEELKG